MEQFTQDKQPAWNICPPVGAPLVFYLNGKQIQRSQNLRGLISRAHKIGVHAVTLFRAKRFSEAEIFVEYNDGSTVRTRFADGSIALEFFRKRYQRWGLDHAVRNSDYYWSFF